MYIDEIVLFEDSSGDYHYYLQDFRYTVYALVDDAGTIEERYRFDPYGKRTVVTDDGSIDEHYGFTGRYHDDSDDTDLIYFRNRWMSPEMGRFVSRDPLDYLDGLNSYTGWFAVNFLDPFGLMKFVIHQPPGLHKDYSPDNYLRKAKKRIDTNLKAYGKLECCDLKTLKECLENALAQYETNYKNAYKDYLKGYSSAFENATKEAKALESVANKASEVIKRYKDKIELYDKWKKRGIWIAAGAGFGVGAIGTAVGIIMTKGSGTPIAVKIGKGFAATTTTTIASIVLERYITKKYIAKEMKDAVTTSDNAQELVEEMTRLHIENQKKLDNKVDELIKNHIYKGKTFWKQFNGNIRQCIRSSCHQE